MPDLCLYFQVHQPYRLRRYRVFDIGTGADYFDDDENRRSSGAWPSKCYLPITGCCAEQIERSRRPLPRAPSRSERARCWTSSQADAPEALESFQAPGRHRRRRAAGRDLLPQPCRARRPGGVRAQVELHRPRDRAPLRPRGPGLPQHGADLPRRDRAVGAGPGLQGDPGRGRRPRARVAVARLTSTARSSRRRSGSFLATTGSATTSASASPTATGTSGRSTADKWADWIARERRAERARLRRLRDLRRAPVGGHRHLRVPGRLPRGARIGGTSRASIRPRSPPREPAGTAELSDAHVVGRRRARHQRLAGQPDAAGGARATLPARRADQGAGRSARCSSPGAAWAPATTATTCAPSGSPTATCTSTSTRTTRPTMPSSRS